MGTTDPLPIGRVGGPCDWPFDLTCCADLDLDDPEKVPPAVTDQAKTWVAEILWMATGRRFGLCERLIRPCNRACLPFWWPRPNLINGQWFNTCGCDNSSDCSCGPLCQICLDGPVADVLDVLIDGEPVDPDSYRVDDHRFLVRTGVEGTQECWPRCQHMDADIDEPGSFAIRYLRGTPVPEGGAFAAGQYLCEMIKMCLGDKSCRLPRNATQVSRAGVSITLGALGRPVTGIPEVDLWISLVNPTQASSPARVWSPDRCDKARVTTSPTTLSRLRLA